MDLSSDNGSFTWQGDAYRGEKGGVIDRDFTLGTLPSGPAIVDTELRGANILGRWSRSSGAGSELTVQAYVDRTERDIPLTFSERRNTADLDLQHRFAWGAKHDILWGGGVRMTDDRLDKSVIAQFTPAHRTDWTFSGFVQDRIEVRSNLHFTLGSKLEHNDYTGIEFQPNLRMTWHPRSNQTLWAAASRAVRIPSRLDSDLRLTLPLSIPGIPVPLYAQVSGSEEFKEETLIAYELGWRLQLGNVLFDVAGFYNDYEDLQTQEARQPIVVPGPPTYILLPNVLLNGKRARGHGGTFYAAWQPVTRWRLKFD
jgi:iron complex outermembrane receptor protein